VACPRRAALHLVVTSRIRHISICRVLGRCGFSMGARVSASSLSMGPTYPFILRRGGRGKISWSEGLIRTAVVTCRTGIIRTAGSATRTPRGVTWSPDSTRLRLPSSRSPGQSGKTCCRRDPRVPRKPRSPRRRTTPVPNRRGERTRPESPVGPRKYGKQAGPRGYPGLPSLTGRKLTTRPRYQESPVLRGSQGPQGLRGRRGRAGLRERGGRAGLKGRRGRAGLREPRRHAGLRETRRHAG
jgi:hypothetical protein